VRSLAYILCILTIVSCSDEDPLSVDNLTLSEFVEAFPELDQTFLIACAGGRDVALIPQFDEPTSVFYLPVSGARDLRYFETDNIADSLDFTKYVEKDFEIGPVFNGALQRYMLDAFEGEKFAIVASVTDDRLHISDPIKLKSNTKPTEVNDALVSVEESGINPNFTWDDGIIDENIIYFQVVTDANNEFISGTYTVDKNFTFYDVSNVVLNITDSLSTPTLIPNEEYTFTLMGISEDNWVNFLSVVPFESN